MTIFKTQEKFLEALLSKEAMGDHRTAMRIAGYSEKTKVAHVVKNLRREIRDATETLLAMYAPKAAFSLVDVLENPSNLNARHIITASKEILDRTGMGVKSATSIQHDENGAIVILPPKRT